MQFVLDFVTAWLLNAMMISAAIWVVLRAFEKLCDIALKVQQYEKNRKEAQ